jgi:hypothetical protein
MAKKQSTSDRNPDLAKTRTISGPPEKLECIHCGRPFYAYQSRYAEYGMCEECDSD